MRYYGLDVEEVLRDGERTAAGTPLDHDLAGGFRFEVLGEDDFDPRLCRCRLLDPDGRVLGTGAGPTAVYAALAAFADAIAPGDGPDDWGAADRRWRPLSERERAQLSARVASSMGWWGARGA